MSVILAVSGFLGGAWLLQMASPRGGEAEWHIDYCVAELMFLAS